MLAEANIHMADAQALELIVGVSPTIPAWRELRIDPIRTLRTE
jgi:hypothetical protein